jgi:hypothetical protein
VGLDAMRWKTRWRERAVGRPRNTESEMRRVFAILILRSSAIGPISNCLQDSAGNSSHVISS